MTEVCTLHASDDDLRRVLGSDDFFFVTEAELAVHKDLFK